MYADFNILNPPNKFKIVTERPYFPNVLIGLEKESYYDFLTKFTDLIGVHLFAAGGQPSYSGTEEVARQIAERTGQGEPTGETDYYGKEILGEHKFLPSLNVVAIADYDPAGINIGNAIASQFDSHMSRRYKTNVKGYRAIPRLENYDDDELKKSSYNVKGATVDQKNWNDRKQERLDRNFVDDRFKNITLYDDSKGSWMMRFLVGGEQKMKAASAKRWIAKWKARIEADADDYPHMFGLEVESLPREPLSRQLPDGFTWNGEGQARAKLFTFEELEKLFPDGLESGYKEWLRINFRNNRQTSVATNKVEEEAGLNDFDVHKERINSLYSTLRKVKALTLKDEIERLTDNIAEWQIVEYDKIIDDTNNLNDYRDELIKAIANDDSHWDFKVKVKEKIFPKVPNNVLEFEVDDVVKDHIKENINLLKNREDEICELISEEAPAGWKDWEWSERYDAGMDDAENLCDNIDRYAKEEEEEE